MPYNDIIGAYFTINVTHRTRSLQLQSIMDVFAIPVQVFNIADNQVAAQFLASTFVGICGVKVRNQTFKRRAIP